MKFIYVLPFLSGLLFSGCVDPEGIIELKGKVLDENTGVPVPGKDIVVQALVQNGESLMPENAGEFCTDSSGCFICKLRKVKNAYLYNFSIVGDSAYAFSNKELGLTELNRYDRFLSFNVSKLTDLTIGIYRQSKTSFYDTLYVSWESNGISDEILYPYKIKNYLNTANKSLRWIGGDIKSTVKTKVFADKTTIVYWKLFRNGKFIEVTDTVFCKSDVVNTVCLQY